jgi:hypothetical protein
MLPWMRMSRLSLTSCAACSRRRGRARSWLAQTVQELLALVSGFGNDALQVGAQRLDVRLEALARPKLCPEQAMAESVNRAASPCAHTINGSSSSFSQARRRPRGIGRKRPSVVAARLIDPHRGPPPAPQTAAGPGRHPP